MYLLTLYVLYTAKGTAIVNPATHVDAITIFVPKIVNRVSIGNTIAVNRSYVTAHKLNTAVINKAPRTQHFFKLYFVKARIVRIHRWDCSRRRVSALQLYLCFSNIYLHNNYCISYWIHRFWNGILSQWTYETCPKRSGEHRERNIYIYVLL